VTTPSSAGRDINECSFRCRALPADVPGPTGGFDAEALLRSRPPGELEKFNALKLKRFAHLVAMP
jgi:hypothetical protein